MNYSICSNTYEPLSFLPVFLTFCAKVWNGLIRIDRAPEKRDREREKNGGGLMWQVRGEAGAWGRMEVQYKGRGKRKEAEMWEG